MRAIILTFIFGLLASSALGQFENGCENDQDCSESHGLRNTVCGHNFSCVCHEEFYFNPDSGHCERMHTRLEGPCSSDQDCNITIPNSICNVGHCRCAYGYEKVENERTCLEVIGKTCSSNNECQSQASGVECRGSCQCPVGQFYLMSVPRCADIPDGLYRACAFDAHCSAMPNSVCRYFGEDRGGGTCRCLFGVLETGDFSSCIVLNQTQCTVDSTCSAMDNLMVCGDDEKCHCGQGSYFNPELNRCYEYPREIAQGRCHTNEQCFNIPGTECRNNWCLCQPNFVEIGGECHLAETLECQGNLDCTDLDPNLQCSAEGTCKCKENYYFSRYLGKNHCVEYTDYVSGGCEQDEHCTNVPNTHCTRARRCECRDGFESHTDSDLGKTVCSLPFGNCETTDDCDGSDKQCVANNDQTMKYCSCQSNKSVQWNYNTRQHYCEFPIYNTCWIAPRSRTICGDHVRDSFCKIIRDGPWPIFEAECQCDVNYHFNNETLLCEAI